MSLIVVIVVVVVISDAFHSVDIISVYFWPTNLTPNVIVVIVLFLLLIIIIPVATFAVLNILMPDKFATLWPKVYDMVFAPISHAANRCIK